MSEAHGVEDQVVQIDFPAGEFVSAQFARQQAERIADLALKLSNAELLCGHHKTVIGERDGRIAALEAALRDLLDRVDRNGGIGPYNGGVPFAVKTARALLGDSK